LILDIYVDNGLLVGSDIEEINKILKELASEFKIKISRNTKIFVDLEIKTEEDYLILSQKEYRISKRFYFRAAWKVRNQ